jgi:hypothetical protein
MPRLRALRAGLNVGVSSLPIDRGFHIASLSPLSLFRPPSAVMFVTVLIVIFRNETCWCTAEMFRKVLAMIESSPWEHQETCWRHL